ncbi:serine dehydratase-like isoform X2 [Ursus maritimus]|uniref:L-serine deaminase n=1 Tax=Ursus maritimus TaxID=29073 RepID=A0A384BX23_URSMA|nr:serine dehydratase-like isoform X2 [Ursus maritimus]
MESSLTGCARAEPFHTVTPLLESWALSQVAGMTVFLKCENVQPAGSFKIRGIGHFCQEMAKKGCRHLVCSSGGNAGIAAAYAARKLGIPATIVLPEGTSPQVVWDEASLKAQELAKRDGWVNVPPFDHPLIWEGHASLVRELKAALGTPPGALVLAVGGGGLLAGVSAGLAEVGWQHVPIIAVETQGAHCFNAAIKAGRLVTLPDITSVAKSLGAKTVAARALACTQELEIISEVVEDVQAVSAVQQFLAFFVCRLVVMGPWGRKRDLQLWLPPAKPSVLLNPTHSSKPIGRAASSQKPHRIASARDDLPPPCTPPVKYQLHEDWNGAYCIHIGNPEPRRMPTHTRHSADMC